jgi:hypothetical protein
MQAIDLLNGLYLIRSTSGLTGIYNAAGWYQHGDYLINRARALAAISAARREV